MLKRFSLPLVTASPSLGHPRLSGLVDPMEGGVSVSPEGVDHLPEAAQTVLENAKGVIFSLDTDELPSPLRYRRDPDNASHGFIEPESPMKFEIYLRAVQDTSYIWQSV